MSDEKIAALVDLQNAAQRAAHKANPVEIQVALQQVLGEEFFVEQFFRYVQDMLLPARDEIIARAEAALAAAEAERDAAVRERDEAIRQRGEHADRSAVHYGDVIRSLTAERDAAVARAEKAEEEARGFASKFLEAGKACIDAEDTLARSLGMDPDALPSGEPGRALADLAAKTARIQAKPCAKFVSREPGTMGASCVHCGFPAAHHRIEPTDYAVGEVNEPGEAPQIESLGSGEGDKTAANPAPGSLTSPETAWLIERGQSVHHVPTVWWVALDEPTTREGERWTQDASEATRFATEAVAQSVIDNLFPTSARFGNEPSAVAVEHAWFAAGEETS